MQPNEAFQYKSEPSKMAELAQQIGLTIVEQRDSDGNPLIENEEQILSTFDEIQLILGADADQGVGKLFITQGYVLMQ